MRQYGPDERVPEAFLEWPSAPTIVAWILMQDRRKQEGSKESTRGFIGQSGAESLAIAGSTLSIFGEIIVRLRETGIEGYPANREGIGFVLHKQSKFSARRERAS